jgi:hypothetical protein
LPEEPMELILNKIRNDYPDLYFRPGQTACWEPEDNTVSYSIPFTEKEAWALCHEIGHAVSGHKSFNSDVDLILKEVDAWEKAKKIAQHYKMSIDDAFIENCLDSYRDWLHKRSTCPACRQKGINNDSTSYRCINCQTLWKVSNNQSNRPYRASKK